jgi:hypothetical protein
MAPPGLEGRLGNVRAWNLRTHTLGNPLYCGVDRCQRFGARMRRQVGQIDIDRESRHVTDKEIDCGAALEGKAILGRDDRQDAQQ